MSNHRALRSPNHHHAGQGASNEKPAAVPRAGSGYRRLIRRHTIRERLNAKLRQVKANLRRMRHLPIPEQGRYLRLVLNGFYNYYAVPTNFRALNSFYWHIMRYWQHCLRRRSQRHRLTCQRMMRIAARWLPSPKLRHPCPDWRFDVMTRGGSPVR